MKKYWLRTVLLIGPLFTFAQNPDSTAFGMEELVISADRFQERRKDLPRQMEIIDSRQIKLWNKTNSADLLQETGTIFIQKSQLGGGSPVLRGFEANRVLLVLDGVRLNNAIFRSGHLQNVLRVDPSALEKTEVLFGPGSLIYGSDAMGGVIHFLTQTPLPGSLQKKGSIQMGYGTAAQDLNSLMTYEWTGKKLGFYFNASITQYRNLRQGGNRNAEIGNLGLRTWYQGRLNDSDIVIQNGDPDIQNASSYMQWNTMGKLVWKPTHSNQHSLGIYLSETKNVPRYDRLTESKGGIPVFAVWYYGPEIFRMVNYQFLHTRSGRFADEYRITVAGQQVQESRHSRMFNDTLVTSRWEEVYVGTLQADFRKRLGIHEVRYGTEFTLNRVHSTANSWDQRINWIFYPASTRYPDGGSTMWWNGYYLSISQEINSRWIFTEGLRFNATYLESNFRDKSFYDFLPDATQQTTRSFCGNLGLVFNTNRKLRLYGNAGNSFRTPNVDDLSKLFDSKAGQVVIVPNSGLKPEQTFSTELGFNWVSPYRFFIEGNMYYTWLTDAILVAPFKAGGSDSILFDGKKTAVFAQVNGRNGYIYGYHLGFRWYLWKSLQLSVSTTYTYGRIQADSLMPLDHIPPQFGKLNLNYEVGAILLSAYMHFSVAKNRKDYYLNGEDNIEYATPNGIPSWYTMNIQVTQRFYKNRITLSAALENLLDRNYRTFASGISAPGRNFRISLRNTF